MNKCNVSFSYCEYIYYIEIFFVNDINTANFCDNIQDALNLNISTEDNLHKIALSKHIICDKYF